MAVPVVLVTAGARPVTAVESGGFPMTPVDTLGEPVTLVDAGGEPITLINEDGSPAFLAYSASKRDTIFFTSPRVVLRRLLSRQGKLMCSYTSEVLISLLIFQALSNQLLIRRRF